MSKEKEKERNLFTERRANGPLTRRAPSSLLMFHKKATGETIWDVILSPWINSALMHTLSPLRSSMDWELPENQLPFLDILGRNPTFTHFRVLNREIMDLEEIAIPFMTLPVFLLMLHRTIRHETTTTTNL